MKNKKLVVITTILCLLPILMGVLFYDKLPDMLATHFDFAGNPNGYSQKAYFIFGFPAFMAAMNLLVIFMLDADPKRQNASPKLRLLSCLLMPVMSLVLMPMVLLPALGVTLPIHLFAPVFCGVLFLVIGNYLPKTRQNYTMGIKLPWTLDSEENWRKTHRLAGYLWTIGGLFMLLSALLPVATSYFFLVVIMTIAFIPMVYSYLLYKKGI